MTTPRVTFGEGCDWSTVERLLTGWTVEVRYQNPGHGGGSYVAKVVRVQDDVLVAQDFSAGTVWETPLAWIHSLEVQPTVRPVAPSKYDFVAEQCAECGAPFNDTNHDDLCEECIRAEDARFGNPEACKEQHDMSDTYDTTATGERIIAPPDTKIYTSMTMRVYRTGNTGHIPVYGRTNQQSRMDAASTLCAITETPFITKTADKEYHVAFRTTHRIVPA